ncbi:hypothetical protein DFQ28_003867 [Apophysomyces sp. BC1034]|nr:hypothetical protein DFQ30_010598 [Apophysomyces sp. BC1015]KAG0180935.1 hypothetical protein DFQ29_009756 [Apophysomyces sp. BC1021]KAG0193694.1 hypothetical protein DFQ28_003867 [Apophysomyces sp. BC1034]
MSTRRTRHLRTYENYRSRLGESTTDVYPIGIKDFRAYAREKSRTNCYKTLRWIIGGLKNHPLHGDEWISTVLSDSTVKKILVDCKKRGRLAEGHAPKSKTKAKPTAKPKPQEKPKRMPLVLPSENDPAVQGDWTCRVIRNGGQPRGFVVMSTDNFASGSIASYAVDIASPPTFVESNPPVDAAMEIYDDSLASISNDDSALDAPSPVYTAPDPLQNDRLSEPTPGQFYVKITIPTMEEIQYKRKILAVGLHRDLAVSIPYES